MKFEIKGFLKRRQCPKPRQAENSGRHLGTSAEAEEQPLYGCWVVILLRAFLAHPLARNNNSSSLGWLHSFFKFLLLMFNNCLNGSIIICGNVLGIQSINSNQ